MIKLERRRPMAEINVVPYIDVMLVLLVIFMITAPLLTQGVNVQLPRAAAEPLPPTDREPVIVTVDKIGRYYINYGENPEQPLPAEQLAGRAAALIRNQPDIPFFVRGDGRVPYASIIQVMALLQQAGVPSVGMVTEPPSS